MDDNGELTGLDPGQLAAWIALIKLAAAIVARADGELRRNHGITGSDYELLHHLSERDEGQRISDLARVIDDSSSCITHRVNRLAASGLVTKRAGSADRRSRLVALTPEGRALLAEAAPAHAARVQHWVVEPLTRRDLADLTRVATKLNRHLRNLEPEPRL
ncbi:MAG: winged helix DNA-binding protein [Acidimicrobiales bacterium]